MNRRVRFRETFPWIRCRTTATALLAAALAVACSASNGAEDSERLCTPGAFVFCRCKNRDAGTKLCKADAKSFDACTKGGRPCPDGESVETSGKAVNEDGTPSNPTSNDADAGPSAVKAVCGDGKVEGNEACDDGNRKSDDGCSSDCLTLDAVTAGGACPGARAAVGSSAIRVRGRLGIGTTSNEATLASCGEVGEPGDTVMYEIIPRTAGTLTAAAVTFKSDFTPTLLITSACGDGATKRACASSGTVTARVESGKSVFMAVTSTSKPFEQSDRFELNLQIR